MRIKITQVEELDELRLRLQSATAKSLLWSTQNSLNAHNWLRAIKFDKVGFDPYKPERPLNLIEQVNQTWSLIAAIEATRLLLQMHPDSGGYWIAPGAHAAQEFDIMSLSPSLVDAEIFAATSPKSNGKLSKEIKKLSTKSRASHRYVMFAAPEYPRTNRQPHLEKAGIHVWSLAEASFSMP